MTLPRKTDTARRAATGAGRWTFRAFLLFCVFLGVIAIGFGVVALEAALR